MSERIYNVFFLGAGNSARSILAESLLNPLGREQFRAFSAGSHPGGQVNPMELELLAGQGMPIDVSRSKRWNEFAISEAPVLDFVFTVCDNVAGEVCPIWPGQPVTARRGIEAPAMVEGSDIAKREVLSSAFRLLNRRISLSANLPIQKPDGLSRQKQLNDIGRSPG